MIDAHNLCKAFKVRKRFTGRLADVRSFISREFREVRALSNVSFHISQGEIVGYLGPNGAGKSTTMKMLSGILVPTSGEVTVRGFIPWRDRKQYTAHIGVVFGQRSTLWWDLPVRESLALLRHIYTIPKARYDENLQEFSHLLDIDTFLDTPARSLSLGQRMRADLCAALLHDPAILFLDEPTIGLDVVAKTRIRSFIQYLNQERGTTVLLTTHDLADVQQLCPRVLIIDQGQLLFDGGLKHLLRQFGAQRHLIVEFAKPFTSEPPTGASIISHEGERVTFAFEPGGLAASELITHLVNQHPIRDLTVKEPDIETTIQRIYEGRLLH